MPERTAEQVQREIENARDALAVAVDQLANKTNPKRLATEARGSAIAKAQTPAGMAVLGGVGLIVALLVIRRVRRGHAE